MDDFCYRAYRGFMDESFVIEDIGTEAIKTVLPELFHEHIQGIVYFMSDTYFRKAEIEKSIKISNNEKGERFPDGIDTFIEKASSENSKSVIMVPLTPDVKTKIENSGLNESFSILYEEGFYAPILATLERSDPGKEGQRKTEIEKVEKHFFKVYSN